MLSQADRIAFSLKIVSADAQIASIATAQSQVSSAIIQAQNLDLANKNLFDGANALVNSYQSEYSLLTGLSSTTVIEQDVVDAANKKLRNYFFPNDTSISVPSLAGANNLWVRYSPYALSYGIGKTYSETNPSITKEGDLIATINALIGSASIFTDIQNTSGQSCGAGGVCSLPAYTTQATCVANAGTWTASDSITDNSDIHTLLTNLKAAINALQSFLASEVITISTLDTNVTNAANNAAAIANINTTLLPALAAWQANPDFNTNHHQTTCAGFNSYSPALLAPTKLYSGQLTALLAIIASRSTFINTRLAQLFAVLGTVAQDISTGLATFSGLYGRRYSYLDLRLNVLGGSLSQLTGLLASSNAQTAVQSNILSTKNTYYAILPTSGLSASGNGTAVIGVNDASFLNPGDQVYIYAENQLELLRVVKSVNGKSIVLNDVVPMKYATSSLARIYKDLS